jgi:hypothetical protein
MKDPDRQSSSDYHPGNLGRRFIVIPLLLMLGASAAWAQTTSFTYQGRLTEGGTPANGAYDLQFALWDSLSGGTQIGSTQTVLGVSVTNGVFRVTLDFGVAAFSGGNRFLEIGARTSGSANPFTILSPRYAITSTPYAIRSLDSTSADALSSACVGCVTVGNGGTGATSFTPNAPLIGNGSGPVSVGSRSGDTTTFATTSGALTNSHCVQIDASGNLVDSGAGCGGGSFIQNTTTTQANSSFNISGNGLIGGNAGIGTSAPAAKLEIADGPTHILFSSGGGCNASTDAAIFFGASLGSNCRRYSLLGNGTDTFLNRPSGGTLHFREANNEQMVILPGGSVGIGTISPAAVLNVVGNSPANTQVHLQGSGNAGGGLRVFPGGTGNTAAVEVYETSDTTLTNYSRGFMNMNYPVPGAFNIFTQAGGSGTARALVFGTNGNEQMRIDPTAGYVGIGTTSPQYKLEVEGGGGTAIFGNSVTVGVYGNSSGGYAGVFGVSSFGPGVLAQTQRGDGNYAGSFLGNVYVSGTVTQNSDRRLKRGIAPLGYGLREIMQLRPVTWTWKQNPGRGVQVGLVAQEVETVVPELVTTAKDTEQTKTLNYIGLVPVVIKAVQEQQATISTLKSENEKLKQQSATTQKDNAALKALLEQQQSEIENLKKLVCRRHRNARGCR